MVDFIVVGGGIAGLAIAEILQRSGASVTLLEKNALLCGEASAEQQGWFHTGALYTALPTDYFCRTMVGNMDDLVDYYSGFKNMNLRVGKNISTSDSGGWFANRTNFYVYASTKAVSWGWKVPWAVALYRAKRRMSWFETLDTTRSLSHQMGFTGKTLRYVVRTSSLGVELEPSAFALKSRDRAMDTRMIADDLLRSFLGSGGVLRTRAKVEKVEKGGVIVGLEGGGVEQIRARHVILSSGKDTGAFEESTRVFVSPLLVVYPALSDVNFVKMSPHMHETINHICHRNQGMEYSVLGNAVYHDALGWSDEAAEGIRLQMLDKAFRVFGRFDPARADLFFGYKTEVSSSSSMRNYLYHIVERDNYTLALPGKFSLCFSLAVNVARHFGIDPVARVSLAQQEATEGAIELPKHTRIARRLAERRLLPERELAEL